METSVCDHGALAGTHCSACYEAYARRGQVSEVRSPAALAHQLGGVLDTCPHGVPLSAPCPTCLGGVRPNEHEHAVATSMVTVAPYGLSAAEAVYGLLGWLTSRENAATFSSRHNACEAADVAKAFCEANGLGDCRPGWERKLIHPEGPQTDHMASIVASAATTGRPAGC